MKNYVKRLISTLLAVLMLMLCLCSCGGGEPAEGAIVSQMYADISALDPARMYDSPTMLVLEQVVEGILEQQMDGSMKPHLCKSWEAVDDLTYVYQMRDDVVFSNGDPMTMEDVLFSIERHRDPEVASYLAWMYDNVESVTQTGDWELTVKLLAPSATWQYTFGTAAGTVIQKAACEAAGDSFGKTPASLVATGPYVVESWTIGSELKLSYNENYWDKSLGEPDVKSITFTVIPEDTTRVSALTSGQADVDLMLPADLMQTIKDSGKVEISLKNSGAFLFLGMNCSKAPFNDVNVRRAIASAIPKDDIANTVISGVGERASMLPMSDYLFTSERSSWEAYAKSAKDYSCDLEQAKAYLAQSGYPDGFTAQLIVDETSLNNAIALVIQQSLKEIGITVNIEKITYDEVIAHEFGSTVDENGLHTYDMGIFEWESDWPDPSGNINGIFNSANIGEYGTNVPDYSNPAVDALLDEQDGLLDQAKRTELLQQALDIIIDECPILPISYTYYKMGFGERVESDYDCVTWNMCFKRMKMKK